MLLSLIGTATSEALADEHIVYGETNLKSLLNSGFRIQALSPILDDSVDTGVQQRGFHVVLGRGADIRFCGASFDLLAGSKDDFDFCALTTEMK
jgi:hypothetical protein